MSDLLGFKSYEYPQLQTEMPMFKNKVDEFKKKDSPKAEPLSPLRLWNEEIKNLTMVSASQDIKPAYIKLVEKIN